MTDAGEAFDLAWSVYRDRAEAERLLRRAYLQLDETSALMQGLHGRKGVRVDGALHLLARHHLADPDDVSAFRSYLQALNDTGIVAYSKKLQTVRVLAPMPAEDDTTPPPKIRVVERERPFSNVLHLRETLRACRGHIWWADAQFSRKGLEPLLHEADANRISEIRIVSGPARVGPDAEKDFRRFAEEMTNIGITAEWRVVDKADQDFHDRFIVSKDRAWNVPPIDTLYIGDYSEISETTAPPFEKWWAKGKKLGT